MGYKSILTLATESDGLAQVLGAASALALQQDGHLDVLAVGVDAAQPAFYGLADAGAVMQVMQISLDQAQADAKVTEAQARTCLSQESPALRWSLEGTAVQVGNLRDLTAQHARFSDLAVLAQPYGKGRPAEAEIVLESALFDGHVPVLLIPQGWARDHSIGRRVVIAWNQSREAMAAVRSALPFLIVADHVNVVVISPPVQSTERSDPAGQLCQMLVRHGVKVDVSVLARTEPRVSDVILRHLRDQAADLLVMGAYGHSRLREAILGGATRELVEQAPVPLLLAH